MVGGDFEVNWGSVSCPAGAAIISPGGPGRRKGKLYKNNENSPKGKNLAPSGLTLGHQWLLVPAQSYFSLLAYQLVYGAKNTDQDEF